jgi:hypothetical protein
MPTPIRLVGHSPYQPLRAIHPPRPRDVQRATEGSALGIALLWCALCVGLIGGVTLTAYWREIVTAALFFLFSAGCALGIHKIDRSQW